MNDPHVNSLKFRAHPDNESITYGDPEPLDFDNQIRGFHLEEVFVTVRLKEHFASVEDARQLVGPFLRAWELQTDFRTNIGQLRFDYKDSNVIARSPAPPGEGRVVHCAAASLTLAAATAE